MINNGDARRTINKPTVRLQSIKAIKPNQTNNRVTGRNMNRATPRGHGKPKENKIVPVNKSNKIKGQQTNNARYLGNAVSKVSYLSGARDSDDSSNHGRSKYTDDDDSFLAYENRVVSSSNQFCSSRCQSPNSSAGMLLTVFKISWFVFINVKCIQIKRKTIMNV